jgi:hypothetical protein
VKLFEHKDFEQAVLRAEEHFRPRGLRAAVIEKDYYVTEALRIVAATANGRTIFKGGTSLSKGWNLIQRFSEDVDIYVDPEAFTPTLGKNGINRELKRIRDAVAAHPALTSLPDESQTIGGFGRNDQFSYNQHFGGPGEIANRVLLEIGTASGKQPVETRQLRSYLGEFLQETGQTLGAGDETGFAMPLLHFRRTFVEKLFAIHDKVELLKADKRPLGSYARHYYDLAMLGTTAEVSGMLNSDEYAVIKKDYDRVSSTHFAKNYRPPNNLSFANSDALFPSDELSAILQKEYEAQCKLLCFGPYPNWEEVLGIAGTLREKL